MIQMMRFDDTESGSVVGLVAVCDACNLPIEDASQGNLYYNEEMHRDDATYGIALTAHKACNWEFQRGHRHLMFQPLETALGYLLRNSGMAKVKA